MDPTIPSFANSAAASIAHAVKLSGATSRVQVDAIVEGHLRQIGLRARFYLTPHFSLPMLREIAAGGEDRRAAE